MDSRFFCMDSRLLCVGRSLSRVDYRPFVRVGSRLLCVDLYPSCGLTSLMFGFTTTDVWVDNSSVWAHGSYVWIDESCVDSRLDPRFLWVDP